MNTLMKMNNGFLEDFFNDDFLSNSLMDNAFLNRKNSYGSVATKEDEKNYYLEMLIPGTSKDNINIEVDENGVMTITSEIKEEDKKDMWYYQNVSKTYTLGDNVDYDSIDSELKDGVLSITIPKKKKEEKKKKVIEVK